MNYSELMALSRVGVSADGICCWRVSPVEREDAEVMVVGVRAMDAVQDAWVDNLPNSRRVCLSWIPSSQQEQNQMFDLFVEGEIEKGYELWMQGFEYRVFTPDSVHIVNLKTKTECHLMKNDNSRRCFQGARCGLCKHEVAAMLEEIWENDQLAICIQDYMASHDLPKV